MRRSAILAVVALLAGCGPTVDAELGLERDEDFEPPVKRSAVAPPGIALPLASRREAEAALDAAGITLQQIVDANFYDKRVLDMSRPIRKAFPPGATITYACAGPGRIPEYHKALWPWLKDYAGYPVYCELIRPVFEYLNRNTGWTFVEEPDVNKATIVISAHRAPCPNSIACAFPVGDWQTNQPPGFRTGYDYLPSDVFTNGVPDCRSPDWAKGDDEWVSIPLEAGGIGCSNFTHELTHALGGPHVVPGSALFTALFNNSCFAGASYRDWGVCLAYNAQPGVAFMRVLRKISGWAGSPPPPPPPPSPPPPVQNGLVLWLDAADKDTVRADGTWVDKSQSLNNAVQPVLAARPTLATRNGKSFLQFDGVNDELVTSRHIDNTDTTIFAVIGQTPGFGGYRTFYTDRDFLLLTRSGARDLWGSWKGFADALTSTRLSDTTTIVTFTGTNNGQTGAFRTNGVADGQFTAGFSNNKSQTVIGDNAGAQQNHPGFIGELIVFNRVLTALEIADMEAYLNAKWLTE